MKRLGIDFGTRTTVAALADASGVDVVRHADATEVLPSAVWLSPAGKVEVGEAAMRRRLMDPQNALFAVKRILGRPWHSREVLQFRNQYGFTLETGADDRPRFVTRVGSLKPGDIVQHLFAAVRTASGLPPGTPGVTVTIPVAAREDQREATRAAAAAAGLPDVVLLEEPCAAAFLYLHDRPTPQTTVVYDLGGGTFDLAVLRWEGDKFTVLGTGGDTYLGGDDITYRLANWAADEVLEQFRWDVRSNTSAFQELVDACESAKIALSDREQVDIPLDGVDPNLARRKITVARGRVESLCSDLVRRTFVLCDQVLASAGVAARAVDAVILVGGGTYMPVIRQGVKSYFGKAPRNDVLPDRAVAMGAALYATRGDG